MTHPFGGRRPILRRLRPFLLAVPALLLVCASVVAARAETLTRTLEELGFDRGLQLGLSRPGSVFMPVPDGAVLNGVRLRTFGNGVIAKSEVAGLRLFVNDVPVDIVAAPDDRFGWQFERVSAIASDTRRPGSALSSDVRGVTVRYSVDLADKTGLCREQQTMLAVSPASRIDLDLDLSGVDGLAGALALLPPETPVVLPAGRRLTPAAFATALRIGLAVRRSGRTPRFTSARPADAVSAIMVVPAGNGEDGLVRLAKPAAERFDIVVSEAADLATFVRLWLDQPDLLRGPVAPRRLDVGRAPAAGVRPGLRSFDRLPGPTEFGRRGEWILPFDLSTPDGGVPTAASLRVALAPDWSSRDPVVSFFLNGQLIEAERVATGDVQDLSVSLPRPLLQQRNVLRVVVDRAPSSDVCARNSDGVFAQLLPGTGLVTTASATAGFAAVSDNLNDGDEYRIGIEAGALSAPRVKANLLFLADVLTALNADGSELIVAAGAGDTTGQDAPPADLLVRHEDGEAVTISLTQSAAIAGALSMENGTPFATATAQGERLTLTVPGPLERYESTRFDLLDGTTALLGSEGVAWQNRASSEGAAAAPQLRGVWNRVWVWGQSYGRIVLLFLLILAALAVLVLIARRLVVRRVARREATVRQR